VINSTALRVLAPGIDFMREMAALAPTASDRSAALSLDVSAPH
jgi:hypothetical protein